MACTMGIPVLTPDGSMNVACETCLNTSCGNQECACVQDPAVIAVDDAGDFAPGCDVFVNCVYGDLVEVFLTTDASLGSALMTAIDACATSDTTLFTGSSVMLGNDLLECIDANCAGPCAP